ncbi:hypothetical protein DBA26_15285 [Brucella canis]|uniref:Uncharacterized protein n=1 Tax=Brucella melitensis TaxID=29459 RepID=A0AB36PZ15_BRUML|nr:hypothetical protein CJJ12_14735 [Brucella melitensis]ASU76603.1 hypothetical protein CJP70_15000 [Brucella abortus]ATN18902.1 hypothetical protein CRN66_03300 [Brucella canis]ASU69973.1 hypothetical protein CJP68_12865 [Brucella melitensis]ASZ31436.1 hypothetical protein CK633_15285 [Brucella melitensis]
MRRSTCPGITSEWPGCNNTSSNVRASAPVGDSTILAIANSFEVRKAASPENGSGAATPQGYWVELALAGNTVISKWKAFWI